VGYHPSVLTKLAYAARERERKPRVEAECKSGLLSGQRPQP